MTQCAVASSRVAAANQYREPITFSAPKLNCPLEQSSSEYVGVVDFPQSDTSQKNVAPETLQLDSLKAPTAHFFLINNKLRVFFQFSISSEAP